MATRFPTAQERRLIAARAIMSERQVYRAYADPQHRKPATLERVRRAALELGLPVPVPEAA